MSAAENDPLAEVDEQESNPWYGFPIGKAMAAMQAFAQGDQARGLELSKDVDAWRDARLERRKHLGPAYPFGMNRRQRRDFVMDALKELERGFCPCGYMVDDSHLCTKCGSHWGAFRRPRSPIETAVSIAEQAWLEAYMKGRTAPTEGFSVYDCLKAWKASTVKAAVESLVKP